MVAHLINRVDPTHFIDDRLLCCALGTYQMTQFNLQVDAYHMITAGAIQGFGMGIVFCPLATIALSTLPRHATAEASGLFSFGRSLGFTSAFHYQQLIYIAKRKLIGIC